MKVVEDKKDRYGRYCLWFSSCNLKDIHDWLFKNYSGYKFVIVVDTTHDEHEPLESPVPVYFMDTVVTEVAEYAGVTALKGGDSDA